MGRAARVIPVIVDGEPEALKSLRDGLAIMERLAKADPSNVQWRNDLQVTIGRIGGLAYRFVLAGDFSNALDAADQVLAPDRLWLRGNRAHALIFLGRVEEARAIYLAHRGARNASASGEKSWETIVLEDFAELRAAKLAHPLMEEIEQLFTAQP